MIRKLSIVGALIGMVMGVAGCGVLGQSGAAVVAPTTLTLHYDQSGLMMQNTGANPMGAPDRLDFVRGVPDADNDDYNAASISDGALAPGQCYALARRNSGPPSIEACAGTVSTEIIPSTPDLFWRAEPVQMPIFLIQWDGVTIHECETYSIIDTGVKTCTFTYPPPPEG